MNLSDYRDRPHWSFSSLNQLLSVCSLAWKFSHIDKLPRPFTPVSLIMGSAYHRVMEFIARAYPFRQQSNRGFARTRFMLAEEFEEHEAESACAAGSTPLLGAGAAEPLLGLPVLGPQEHE